MDIYNVYNKWNIEPVKGYMTTIWDKNGVEYTDLYGGHAVISIGHSHPLYIKRIEEQLEKIGFYSNAVNNSLQTDLAYKLGEMCGYPDYSLFLCNSGAEANENALKAASFETGRKKILALNNSFHGRTSGAVEATDNDSIKSPFNKNNNVVFVPINDSDAAIFELNTHEYAAFIIEGIQGVAGIYEPETEFLHKIARACKESGTLLIVDEIQSGYGRTGKFFAHQYAGIKADIVTMAKGIANGFPMGGVIFSPEIKAKQGMLGTTFGGNHLACAAALAVLEIMKSENLIKNAVEIGDIIINGLHNSLSIKEIRGKGLMIGIELKHGYENLRERLLFEEHYFTGGAGKNVIRILPPLCLTKETALNFISAFKKIEAND